jgi:hypothetical protein
VNGDDTRQAAALARHIKAALLHLRQAEDIAAAAGIDIDDGNDTARLIRTAGEAAEDLDLWAVNNARGHGAAPAETYQHTERWCHAPGGTCPPGPGRRRRSRQQPAGRRNYASCTRTGWPSTQSRRAAQPSSRPSPRRRPGHN